VNPRFKTNLIEHTKAVAAWARRHGARAVVDAISFTLTLNVQGQSFVLHPQFVGKREGGQWLYFDQPDAFAMGFVGWLPYKPLAWDISLSKLAFKQLAHELGLATPAHWLALPAMPALPELPAPQAPARGEARGEAGVDVPCLVKRVRGAFGYGMRGPFSPADLALELQQRPLVSGEYLEAFCWGRIARAWYWSGQLTVLEVFDMPRLQGDGKSPVLELLQRRAVEVPEDLEALLRLQGVGGDTVLPQGQELVCDYRYVSPLNPTVYTNHNVLRRAAGSTLVQRFEAAGRLLWPRIPAPSGAAGRQAGYVLDAIVDSHDEPWFLEINSNAQGHPDGYAAMLDQLCAPALRQPRVA
jgi:hypothetical protein